MGDDDEHEDEDSDEFDRDEDEDEFMCSGGYGSQDATLKNQETD